MSITRFNNNTDFCCFVNLGCLNGWPVLSFSQTKSSSFLKGRKISKQINQGLYKAGPEFSFETSMTFKEGWNFSQFCPEKNWVFSSFELLNFWPAEFSQFFYCEYLGSNIYLGFACLALLGKKVNKLLQNILVTSSPKTNKNQVTKMGWKQHLSRMHCMFSKIVQQILDS